MTLAKIMRDLDRQQRIEGDSEDLRLLRFAASVLKTSMQWQTLTDVRWHKYGSQSYQVHRFYVPTPELKKLVAYNLEEMS